MKPTKFFALGVCLCVTMIHAGVLFLVNYASLNQNGVKNPSIIMEMVNLDLPATDQLTNVGQGTQEIKQEPAPHTTKTKQKSQMAHAESQVIPPTPVQKKSTQIKTTQQTQTVAVKTPTNETMTRTVTNNKSDVPAASSHQEVAVAEKKSKASTTSASTAKGTEQASTSSLGKDTGKEGATSSGKNGGGAASQSGSGNSQASGGGGGATTTASISRGQISSIERKYPEDARLADIEGTVHLKVVVDARGRAKTVTVVGSSHRLLNNAARLGAKNAKYTPAFNAGKAIEGEVKFSIAYRLKG